MEEQQNSPLNPEPTAVTPVTSPPAESANSTNEIGSGEAAAAKAGGDQQAQTAQSVPGAGTGEQDFTAGQAGTQPPVAEPAAQPQPQPGQTQQTYQLPPGYAVDPATGQVVFVGPAMQQPAQSGYVQPGVVYMQPTKPSPEQIAAQQAASQQRYGQIINTVEHFLEGEATVSDMVKTLYANTTQDDQLWKGVIVGAAAAVLLTSEPVRDAMGKTFGGLFPGLKKESTPSAKTAADTSPEPTIKKE